MDKPTGNPNPKSKSFLIGKELKTKDLRKTTALRTSGSHPKTRIKPPDSLRQEASQAAGAAPTLRYGPAGDSAPRLRLSGWYGRKVPFRPVHTARMSPFPLINSHPFGLARSSPGREAAKRTLDGEDRSEIIQGEGKGGSYCVYQ